MWEDARKLVSDVQAAQEAFEKSGNTAALLATRARGAAFAKELAAVRKAESKKAKKRGSVETRLDSLIALTRLGVQLSAIDVRIPSTFILLWLTSLAWNGRSSGGPA